MSASFHAKIDRVKTRPDHGSLASITYPKVDRLDLHFIRWLGIVGCVSLFWDLEFSWASFLDAVLISIIVLGT
jgi:hypothetical protein